MSDNRMDRRQVLGRGAALAGLAALSTEALFAAEASAGYKATSAYKGTLRVVGLGVDLIPQIKTAYEKTHPGVKLQFTVKDTPGSGRSSSRSRRRRTSCPATTTSWTRCGRRATSSRSRSRRSPRSTSISRLIKHGALKAGRPARPGRRAVPQDLPRQLEEEVRHRRDQVADDDPGQPQLRLVRIQREGSRRQAGLVGLALRQPLQGPRRAHQRPGHRLHRRRHGRQGLRQDDDEGPRRTRPRRRSTTSRRSSRISRRPGTSRPSGRRSRSRCTFMQTGAVVVESMWSPAVTLLQEAQFPVRYAAPKEGFRGWGGGNAILTHVTGDKLDAAYDYLNWWNTPVPAGIMATQGYYNANISAVAQGPGLEQRRSAASPPTTTGSRARRPRSRSSAPTASRASRSAPSATAAPTSTAPAGSTPGTRRASTATTCCRSGRSSSPPDRRGADAKPKSTRRSGRPSGRPLHAVVEYPLPFPSQPKVPDS